MWSFKRKPKNIYKIIYSCGSDHRDKYTALIKAKDEAEAWKKVCASYCSGLYMISIEVLNPEVKKEEKLNEARRAQKSQVSDNFIC